MKNNSDCISGALDRATRKTLTHVFKGWFCCHPNKNTKMLTFSEHSLCPWEKRAMHNWVRDFAKKAHITVRKNYPKYTVSKAHHPIAKEEITRVVDFVQAILKTCESYCGMCTFCKVLHPLDILPQTLVSAHTAFWRCVACHTHPMGKPRHPGYLCPIRYRRKHMG